MAKVSKITKKKLMIQKRNGPQKISKQLSSVPCLLFQQADYLKISNFLHQHAEVGSMRGRCNLPISCKTNIGRKVSVTSSTLPKKTGCKIDIPWLDHVTDQEQDTQEPTESTNSHVGNTQERVLTSQNRDSGDDN
jgi:hypothetical protein